MSVDNNNNNISDLNYNDNNSYNDNIQQQWWQWRKLTMTQLSEYVCARQPQHDLQSEFVHYSNQDPTCHENGT